MKKSLRSQYTRGVSWNVIGAIFSQGSLFICNILLANILGRKGYGEFGMIQSTIITLSGVAQLATGFAATKYVAEFRYTDKEKTGRILGLCSTVSFVMGCIVTVVLLICAPWLAANTLRAPHLDTGLLIASCTVFFSVLNGYQLGALAGLECYGTIARLGIVHGVLHLIVCSAAGWFWGLNGALVGFVFSALLRLLIFRWSLIRASGALGITFIYQGIWSERDIIFKFAVPAALSGLSTMPIVWLNNTMLVRLPDGYSQMGIYSATNSLKSMIIFLPQLINNVGTSLMNSQKGRGNYNEYKKVFQINLAMTAGIVLTCTLFVAIFGSWILRIFGKDFVEGNKVLLVLSLAVIPEALGIAFYQIIQVKTKMWLSFSTVTLPRDFTNLIAAYFLIPTFGAVGMASAYALSQVVTLLCIIIIVSRIGFDYRSDDADLKAKREVNKITTLDGNS